MSNQTGKAAVETAIRPDAPRLTDESPFPMRSKYHGVPIGELPAWFLDLAVDWRVIREDYPQVIDYVNRNRGLIDTELEEDNRI